MNIYITQLQQYNSKIEKKYNKHNPKVSIFSNKLLQWKQVNDKYNFKTDYENSYKKLLGM